MGKEKEEDFKIVDKRHSATSSQEEETAKGESFTMKDVEEAAPNQLDFATLIFSFATGALINMGVAPDPASKKTVKNLELARQNIDILNMLKDKTKGNLTPEENKLLESLLTEVRLRFVESTR